MSKVWFTLVAFAAAVALAFGILVFAVSSRQLAAAQGERLDLAQYGAHLLLKVNIRAWLDESARISLDPELAQASEGFGATSDEGERTNIHEDAQRRLQTLNEKLKADLLILVDAKGKVIARVGLDAKSWGDGLIGYPLVEQVIRGYRRDDVWALDGQVYRMAGAPVASRGRDRTAGALLIGLRVDDEFAKQLSDGLGTDIAFLLAGRVIAKSLGSTVVYSLPDLLAQNRDVLRKHGRTPPLSVSGGGSTYRAVIAPMVGEAADQDACYVLLAERPASATALGVLRMIERGDVAWGRFPWLLVAGALMLALAGGLALMAFEVEIPLGRLLVQSRDVARGASGKVNDAVLRGKYGSIGRAVNETIEKSRKGQTGKRDIGQMLSGTGEQTPVRGRTTKPIERSSGQWGRSVKTGTETPVAPASVVAAAIRSPSASPRVPSPVKTGDSSAPRSAPGGGIRPLAPPMGAGPPGSEPGPALSASQMQTMAADPMATLLDDPSLLQEETTFDEDPSGVDDYLRQVYTDFAELKKKCGEADVVAYEKFSAKLKDNRKQMIERFACKDVKFVVYVKDGKAAVKASPVKA